VDSKDYHVGWIYAKYYWKYIRQIPKEIEVYSTRKQGSIKIFNVKISFKRMRKMDNFDYVKRNIYNHAFNIVSKKHTKKQIK